MVKGPYLPVYAGEVGPGPDMDREGLEATVFYKSRFYHVAWTMDGWDVRPESGEVLLGLVKREASPKRGKR